MNNIDIFINTLANTPPPANTYNQFADNGDPNNKIRRDNLTLYLQLMQKQAPDTILVMEAPGYRGSRITGVPVTSRKVLLEGVEGIPLFGADRGFRDADDTGFERVYGEQSATIVWGTLAQIGCIPLIWNTFPFHPYKPEQFLSNRKPKKAEIELGKPFITALLEIFVPKEVIAIGNVAHETLTTMGLTCPKVRHPAQGGKNDFVRGLQRLLS